jgi:hypothetical protein
MTERRKATQRWQQKLATKDTVEYEELNAEVYKNVNSSPHFDDSIGWHVALEERYMKRPLKSAYARAWLRRLLWRYGMNLEGATRKTLYREAYRLYEDAVDDGRREVWDQLLKLIGEQPRQIFHWDVEEGRATQEERDQAHADLQDWYGKLYAIRNATGMTGNYADFPTDWEITFTKKNKPITIEDI